MPRYVDEWLMPGAIVRDLLLVSLCCVSPSPVMLDWTSRSYRLLACANMKTRCYYHSVLLHDLALPGSSLPDIWS
jgi:hypothetical protein